MKKSSNKRILFMRGYFPPENAASNQMCVDLLYALETNGYIINLICPLPTRGVTNEIRKKYKKIKDEYLNDNIHIRRYWLPKEGKSIFARGVRYLLQNIYQIIYGITHKYDVLYLYSTPPTNGVVGSLLKLIKRKPFIYNLHDVFPDSIVKLGFITKDNILFPIFKSMEKFTYKHASAIIAVSEGIRQNVLDKGVNPSKVSVVYNWADISKIKKINRHENTLLHEINLNNDDFIVTYAGNIGEAQGVTTIIESAIYLKNEKNIIFVIIGNGAKENECKSLAKSNSLDNVIFFPMQGIDRLSEVYSLGDVSLVACKAGFGNVGMPSKTGSIMSTKTPVLASFDINSELSNIILNNNAGICVEPDNPKALAKAIIELKSNLEICHSLGLNGYKFLISNMTKEICTEKIINIINIFGDLGDSNEEYGS